VPGVHEFSKLVLVLLLMSVSVSVMSVLEVVQIPLGDRIDQGR